MEVVVASHNLSHDTFAFDDDNMETGVCDPNSSLCFYLWLLEPVQDADRRKGSILMFHENACLFQGRE